MTQGQPDAQPDRKATGNKAGKASKGTLWSFRLIRATQGLRIWIREPKSQEWMMNSGKRTGYIGFAMKTCNKFTVHYLEP